MSGLKDKVVIITGSSSGIGASTALEFAKVGAQVVLTARRKDRLEETAEACQKAGLDKDKILIVVGDVTKKEDLENLVKTTVDKFGGIDVLVNNAGSVVCAPFIESSEDDLDLMYSTNLKSVFILTKLAIPHIIERKGNIVNVSSVAAVRPVSLTPVYGPIKAAQTHLVRQLCTELGPMGVRVNSLLPGVITTDAMDNAGIPNIDEFWEANGQINPLMRQGFPIEVAKVIVFLASDDASFVTGIAMPVDGGRMNVTQ